MEVGTRNACPYCDARLPSGAASCPSCGLPLAEGGADEDGKVPLKAEYCDGPLRLVTVAANQAEAELIEGFLRSAGIPSVVKRSGGADVPDFLAAGRRDVLVPSTGLGVARELLQLPPEPAAVSGPNPRALALALLTGTLLVVAIVALGYLLS